MGATSSCRKDLHGIEAWEGVSVEVRERVIGRRKTPDSVVGHGGPESFRPIAAMTLRPRTPVS
ncbi:hypothetical protein [Streptomyces sp. NPDC056337]|uniref:hypothetical protein n=1 Tax=Streptomyces sp. NPDC056337 TaxID=3345787 RepID=UPI0035D735F8